MICQIREVLFFDSFSGFDSTGIIMLDLFHFGDEIGKLHNGSRSVSACEYKLRCFGAGFYHFGYFSLLQQPERQGDVYFIKDNNIVFTGENSFPCFFEPFFSEAYLFSAGDAADKAVIAVSFHHDIFFKGVNGNIF